MIGQVVGGQKLVEKLGEGGMGIVYRAEDQMLGRSTAVKMLRAELSLNKEIVQRFFNEAKAAAALRHIGIVEIYAFGYHDDGAAYLVMELLDGESLEERLKKRPKLAVDDAVRITRHVCSALAAAHEKQIVHRDLKPDNIFLVPDPDFPGGERIKILDFGIAKLSGDGGPAGFATRTGAVFGTPAFMAPEQCRGAANVDARADLYAIGCILFRMVTADVPFVGELTGDVMAAQIRDLPPRPREMDPAIPPALEAVVLRLLEKKPEDRYQSARELRGALDDLDKQPRHPTPVPISIHSTLPGAGGRLDRLARTEMSTKAKAREAHLDTTPAPQSGEAVLATPTPTPPPIEPTMPAPSRQNAASPQTTLGHAAGMAATASGGTRGRTWIVAGVIGLLLVGGAASAVIGLSGGDGDNKSVVDAGVAVTTPVRFDAAAVSPIDAAPEKVASPAEIYRDKMAMANAAFKDREWALASQLASEAVAAKAGDSDAIKLRKRADDALAASKKLIELEKAAASKDYVALPRLSRALKKTPFERDGRKIVEKAKKAQLRELIDAAGKGCENGSKVSLAKVPWRSVKESFWKACKLPVEPSTTCGSKERALAREVAGLANRMCRCKDAACGEAVEKRTEALEEKAEKMGYMKKSDVPECLRKPVEISFDKFNKCRRKLREATRSKSKSTDSTQSKEPTKSTK